MKNCKPPRRILSFVLSLALLCGLGLSARASAFEWPNSFWAVHAAWNNALESKDPDRILSVVTETYNLLMTYERNTTVYGNLEFKCGWAALCCELKGDLEGAIMWLERQQALCQWLTDNGLDRKDVLLNASPRLEFLRTAANPVIYALSDDAESPYDYGPRHGAWRGSALAEGGGKSGESAVLAYVVFQDGYSMEYWLNYYKSNYPEFKRAAAEGGVIELAWNFSPENTASVRRVLDPASDAYINEALKAISQLNATVLLRVGAEMNVWTQDCDPAVFREAYRKLSAAARQYPNIQTSWSPGDVGSRNYTWDDFWPGDEYVDWVGMSSYRNNGAFYSQGTAIPASYSLDYQNYIYNDAYYGVGVYSANPLAPIKSLVDFAAAHGKPVMISECGSAYYDKTTGKDQTDFAVKTLTTFYSYVNMIYPQVKAVFYFNEDSAVASYRLDGSAAVNSAYDKVTHNGSYLSFGQTECMNWEPLDKTTLSSGEGKLTLATYAMIPGSSAATTSVRYYVDGQWKTRSDAAPYTYSLDLSALSAGKHTIQATVVCTDGSRSAQVRTVEYTIQVPGQTAASTASASTEHVLLDSKNVDFPTFQINDANYVKLRDLAYALNGTQAQFEVGYNEAADSITLTTGQAYTPAENHSELAAHTVTSAPYAQNSSALILNGKQVQLTAYTINGYNYFKLRDLGRALGFNVSWINERIVIATNEPYSDAQ